MFSAMYVQDWRQFGHVHIDFDERVTILTGANGAGKTTLLNILSQHFGWSINLVATRNLRRKDAYEYFSGAYSVESSPDGRARIGELLYTDGNVSRLSVPADSTSPQFNVQIDSRQNVQGIYVTSHRPVYAYQAVDSIPTKVQAHQQLFDEYLSNLRRLYASNTKIESPSYRLKSALISLATFGYGNEAVEADFESRQIFEGFQQALRIVLPSELGFRRITVRVPEVILQCTDQDFSLDAASGGLAALIDIAWQIFMKSLTADRFVVILDEPENHLHPRLQRAILPSLVEAFPQVQFIVATHNPFVVTSVPDSSVYVLDFAAGGRVHSSNLSSRDRAGSADEVLSDVLGVPFTRPIWVEREVRAVVDELSAVELSSTSLQAARDRLSAAGLGDYFPTVIEDVMNRRPVAE